ncbi:MAG: hypothetical protein AAF570_29270, partial [Bacteroidota bacterium]
DLIPGHSKLSDLIPNIHRIYLNYEPGKLCYFKLYIQGGGPRKSLKEVRLKFQDASGDTYSKLVLRDRVHELDFNSSAPNITEIRWRVTEVSEEDESDTDQFDNSSQTTP